MEVYKAITSICGELAKRGIEKSRKNQQQGFAYRGIDDVYAALSPLLADHNLCIVPRIVDKTVLERVNAKGTALFYTTVTAEFDVISATDGSLHTARTYGEAMDSGDKSIGKAMSYAYKAMAFMLFAIPTEGDNDPDAACHELQSLDASIVDKLKNCTTLPELQAAWLAIPVSNRAKYTNVKDESKNKVMETPNGN